MASGVHACGCTSGFSALRTPRQTGAVLRCTQEVMEEPVLAADGFSYERSAILQWLQLGHTTSPMTNQPLQHPGLTNNRALRAAIQQWKSQ